jgi:hypothetical protein
MFRSMVNASPNIPAADTAPHHRAVLDDLIDLGHELARLVVEEAKAKILPAADAAIAFERIARGIRRAIALARRLDEPVPSVDRDVDRVAARKHIIRAVEDTIQRHADAAQADTLHRELQERLDAPDLDDEIDNRPAEDIIAEICRDFGLAAPRGGRPWKRRTPTDIAALRARAAQQIPGAERTAVLLRGPGAEPWAPPIALNTHPPPGIAL